MFYSQRKPSRLALILLAAGIVVLVGCALWIVPDRSSALPPPPSLEGIIRSRKSSDWRMLTNDGDFTYGMQNYFVAQIKDPSSLIDIRDCYAGAGFRAIKGLEDSLARLTDRFSPGDQMSVRVRMAKLFMYEGEFARAAAILGEVRATVEADPNFANWVPPLAFLQGLTALRLGETENCVACSCMASCIFPLKPEAVHRKREGSTNAVRYFSEYLSYCPDDLGARWLLNIAYMTLGEYPERVPHRYLIPPETFTSKQTIGRFRNVAAELGVDRLEQAGGAIMEDFDNDGQLDIVITSWDPQVPMAFFKNRGDGTFEERAQAAGLASQLGGLYCVQTDYNNDGWRDIYVCRGAWWGKPMRHSLLRNNRDGTFTDVTQTAGLAGLMDSQVAAWADYDLDGCLDVLVGGETVPCRLYHNKGDGTFEDVTARSEIRTAMRFCKGAAWGDFDGDGFPDLFLSFCDGPPSLYHNNGNGRFTDRAVSLGITGPKDSFACCVWDYDNDGWPDLFVARGLWDRADLQEAIRSYVQRPDYRGETYRLYHNKAGQGFEDVTRKVGLDLAIPVMGCSFGDLDNDGFLDLYLGTGGPQYAMLVPNLLFRNVQGQKFVDITASSGTGHLQKGHGVAIGDWDRDGNLDIFAHLGAAYPGDTSRNALFQNPGGHGNHWIDVKLVGVQSNRPGIGARIKIVPAGQEAHPIYRWVTSGSSFGANPLEQHIGIGKADNIDALEVSWPASHTTQVFRHLKADQAIELTEGQPTFTSFTAPAPSARKRRSAEN